MARQASRVKEWIGAKGKDRKGKAGKVGWGLARCCADWQGWRALALLGWVWRGED
jgi:hypothetical protein